MSQTLPVFKCGELVPDSLIQKVVNRSPPSLACRKLVPDHISRNSLNATKEKTVGALPFAQIFWLLLNK